MARIRTPRRLAAVALIVTVLGAGMAQAAGGAFDRP
jgi:hypothetical protein